MKFIILIILCVFTVISAKAQSKKKVNAELLTAYRTVKYSSDSLETIRGEQEKEMIYLTDHLVSLKRGIENQQRTESNTRYEIKAFHADLVKLGFNADSMYSLNELGSLVSPLQKENVLETQIPEYQSYDFVLVAALQDLTDVKTKVQNELLKHKIEEFEKTNKLNMEILLNQRIRNDELRAIQTKFEVFIEGYYAFNRGLAEKSTILKRKYFEVGRKKEEAERLQREKELAAANKKVKKPKVIEFVEPPMMELKEYQKDGTVSNDDYFSEPPLPPPTIQPMNPEIFDVVEQPAEYPGGQQAMKDYLIANLKYPQTALDMGIQGKCYIKFVISESGKVSNVIVAKGVPDCHECDSEAVRVVKSMPKWTPAVNNGKAVNCWYTLPVAFKIVQKGK